LKSELLRLVCDTAALLKSRGHFGFVFHDDGGVEEFDGGFDLELFTDHRGDALLHETAGGFIVFPQVNAAGGAAVGREEELLADEAGDIAENGCNLDKAGLHLGGIKGGGDGEARDDGDHGRILAGMA